MMTFGLVKVGAMASVGLILLLLCGESFGSIVEQVMDQEVYRFYGSVVEWLG